MSIVISQRFSKVFLLIALIMYMHVFMGNTVLAKTSAIEVNFLNVTELNNELRLDAEITYELNSKVREALVNGIELIFQIEVQIKSLQEWRWDKVISTIVKTHSLKYHALSKQYVLKDLESGETDTFPDLDSALIQQGRIAALYIADTDYLKKKGKCTVQLRVRLLGNKLPLPLRMKSYFSPKWRLSSGWHEWPL